MTITTKTIKFLGERMKFWQVIDTAGEVLKVATSQQEAAAWIAAH